MNHSDSWDDLAAQTAVQKAELRRSLLQTRQSLLPEAWREKSDRLCAHLQANPLFTQSQTILAYFSFRQEPDLSPLFMPSDFGLSDFSPSHRWGFSRCVGRSLSWHLWSPAASLPLQVGAYGILEPHANALMLHAEEIDLILVPAVACDARGYRLGYGGGFYDRMLSSPVWSTKPTIGIVFEFSRLACLPTNSWDCPLQGICTEQGFFEV